VDFCASGYILLVSRQSSSTERFCIVVIDFIRRFTVDPTLVFRFQNRFFISWENS